MFFLSGVRQIQKAAYWHVFDVSDTIGRDKTTYDWCSWQILVQLTPGYGSKVVRNVVQI